MLKTRSLTQLEFSNQLSMFVNFEDPQEVVKEVKSSEQFNRNLLKESKN